jgi:type II secretory pathway component PulL
MIFLRMKKVVILLLLMMPFTNVSAQNERHSNVVETFVKDFNVNDFEKIFQSFSPKMQRAHSKKYYFDFFSKLKKDNGNLLLLELLEYQENSSNQSRATFDGNFENDILTVKISVDGQNKISGLYFKKKILI